jgi:hypothetical protein
VIAQTNTLALADKRSPSSPRTRLRPTDTFPRSTQAIQKSLSTPDLLKMAVPYPPRFYKKQYEEAVKLFDDGDIDKCITEARKNLA